MGLVFYRRRSGISRRQGGCGRYRRFFRFRCRRSSSYGDFVFVGPSSGRCGRVGCGGGRCGREIGGNSEVIPGVHQVF